MYAKVEETKSVSEQKEQRNVASVSAKQKCEFMVKQKSRELDIFIVIDDTYLQIYDSFQRQKV